MSTVPLCAVCARCDGRGWNLCEARIAPCDCGTYDPPRWVRNGDRPCLLPHHKDPDRPRRAAVGWLCAGHYRRFEQNLAELPALYDDLALQLTSSEKPGGEQGRAKHSQIIGGVNLNEKVAAARQELHDECVRIARAVSEGTGDDLPRVDTVPVITAWLLRRLTWMAEQDDADDTFRYLAELTVAATRLAFPNGRRRVSIGPCNTDGCPGELITVVSRTAELLPDVIWCDECGRQIPPAQWRTLRRQLGDDTDVILTVTQACDLYAVPYRTLARWVADGKIANVSDGYPAKIRAADVEEQMQKLGVLRDSA